MTQTIKSVISPTCRVCEKSVEEIFSAVLLQKHLTQYFQCLNCGYVQTGEPSWLEEAYNTPISDLDTGIMMRSFWHRNIASTIIYSLFNQKGQYLDYGAGYGVFVRLMRDVGFDFLGRINTLKICLLKGLNFWSQKTRKWSF